VLRDMAEHDHLQRQIAQIIADLALRECTFLDELWMMRNKSTCAPLIKGRHKRFLTELLGYYGCLCGVFLRSDGAPLIHPFMQRLTSLIAIAALGDPATYHAPYFRADLPKVRMKRFHRRIVQRLEQFGDFSPDIAKEALIVSTADEIAYWMGPPASDYPELVSQIARRLRWTADELLGTARLEIRSQV